MPNTLIRHGWVDSERIDRLSPDAERFFLRLMLNADDAGRFDGRTEILRARLFPLKVSLRVQDVESWRERCIAEHLVSRWEWENKPILQVMRFQRRSPAKVSKYPDPTGDFRIVFVTRSTPDGKKEFVSTSLANAIPMASGTDPRPLPGFLADTPETESGTESESQTTGALRGEGGGWFELMLANEELRTMPPALDTAAFRAAWLRWVRHLFGRKSNGRRPSLETLGAHLAQLETMPLADAIAAITHAISLDWSRPELPNETNRGLHHAKHAATTRQFTGPNERDAKLA